jgi:hypothetical protein
MIPNVAKVRIRTAEESGQPRIKTPGEKGQPLKLTAKESGQVRIRIITARVRM